MRSHFCASMFLFLVGALIISPARSEDEIRSNISTTTNIEQTRKELRDKELAFLAAPIKNGDDLKEYLESIRGRSSPIDALSDGARQRFLDSLKFNERGVTGFRYSELESELTVSQIYKILSLFGAQHATPRFKRAKIISSTDRMIGTMNFSEAYPDHMGYDCIKRATCKVEQSHICMNGC